MWQQIFVRAFFLLVSIVYFVAFFRMAYCVDEMVGATPVTHWALAPYTMFVIGGVAGLWLAIFPPKELKPKKKCC